MSFVNYLFFFNDPATTEIYTLSLHDALPISGQRDQLRRRLRHLAAEALQDRGAAAADGGRLLVEEPGRADQDRKSTRLNSSHPSISYAVFCLKKKKTSINHNPHNSTHFHTEL